MIFDPSEHEPLLERDWDETLASAFVDRTVREADSAYDGGWPLHPEDQDDDEPGPHFGVYFGAAGTMWALTHLARMRGIPLQQDYGTAIAWCERDYRSNRTGTDTVVPSFCMGTVGITLARYVITGDVSALDLIETEVRDNVGNPTREVLWGSSGTAVAALLVRERDGDDRFDTALRAVQDELWETWEPESQLWEQDLYGKRRYFFGAGHGAIGNLAPLIRATDLLSPERRNALLTRVPDLLETYIMRDGIAANWPSLCAPRSGNRMQWCHGSPGVITSLAAFPADNERVEEMLIAGGEGIWQAGPIRKGPTLCHGTAGNGFAFLQLASRTGDPQWRRRAERFAMHAIGQVTNWREEFGMPSFSLWTGELGVALFVNAILRNDPAILTQDCM